MTVQYNQDVLTGGPVVFLRLLLRWKGCVLKLIYTDLIVFIIAYIIICCIYRFALTEPQQRTFESVIVYVGSFQKMIPISFILGFYVQLVFNRFWEQFNTVPWVFSTSIAIAGTIPGDGRARLIRRTCIRYMNASLIIASSRLHVVAKKRFPTIQHLVQAGILTQREGNLISATDPIAAQPFLPLVWTTSIIMRAERDGLIRNEHALVNLIQVVNDFRQSLLKLFLMDTVCIPLVYTQVVTLAVYSYFASSVVGSQYIVESSPYSTISNKDYYIPFYTILELIVYMGWLKVAETLVNPMGEDDEDFDINLIIDFNWSYSMQLVEKSKQPSQLVKDKFWNQSTFQLPHTDDSRRLHGSQIVGSIFTIGVPGANETAGSGLSVNAPILPAKNESEEVGFGSRVKLSSGSNYSAPVLTCEDVVGNTIETVRSDERQPLEVVVEVDEENDLERITPPKMHAHDEAQSTAMSRGNKKASVEHGSEVKRKHHHKRVETEKGPHQIIPVICVKSPSLVHEPEDG